MPIRRLVGHTNDVCGLTYNSEGVLATGSNDNTVRVWDSAGLQRHLFQHQAAVKALAWCPLQSNLLATGGGSADGHIRLFNSCSGELLSEKSVGSQVCSLLWSKRDFELLSGHGFACAGAQHELMNQMVLWRGGDLACISELKGHSSRVLNMVQSPDGKRVVSQGADETLRFWDVFREENLAQGFAAPLSVETLTLR
jgi:WD40 repeat protein